MKKIPVAEKPKTIFGKPFRIVDFDANPKPDEEQKFIEEASAVELLTLMVYGIPRDKLTMKDSIEAGRFMEQLRASVDGMLILEEAEHDWIKKMVDTFGTSVYGVNASVLADILDSFERLHEKKEEKKSD
jgi:hypothetical protein